MTPCLEGFKDEGHPLVDHARILDRTRDHDYRLELQRLSCCAQLLRVRNWESDRLVLRSGAVEDFCCTAAVLGPVPHQIEVDGNLRWRPPGTGGVAAVFSLDNKRRTRWGLDAVSRYFSRPYSEAASVARSWRTFHGTTKSSQETKLARRSKEKEPPPCRSP